MKKIILLLYIACSFLTSCYDPNVQESKSLPHAKSKVDGSGSGKNEIVVAGSTTMKPILENVSNYFSAKNQEYTIVVEGTGSNEGLKAIWSDSADIAMSSAQISDTMVARFRKEKMEYAEFLLAGDALVFIVNVNNEVHKLTDENLKKIFRGEIVNWKEVGGEDLPITLYSRDATSGTFTFFKELILDKQEPPIDITMMKDNDLIMKSVAKEKGAIGYVSFANLDYSVEPLGISFDGGKTYVLPRVETVNNFKYKYFRGLYLYYKPNSYSKIKAFLDTVKTDTVQQIIRQSGYIPLSHRLIHNQ